MDSLREGKYQKSGDKKSDYIKCCVLGIYCHVTNYDKMLWLDITVISRLGRISKELLKSAPNRIRWVLLTGPGGSASWFLTHLVGKLAVVVGREGVQLRVLAGGPWFLSIWVPPRGYLCFLTAWWMSSERECSKRQEVKLTGQLRATSRTGIVCLHRKQILPLRGGMAWLYCRRPHVIGGTIFGKYSLPNAALLMKLHSHIYIKGEKTPW